MQRVQGGERREARRLRGVWSRGHDRWLGGVGWAAATASCSWREGGAGQICGSGLVLMIQHVMSRRRGETRSGWRGSGNRLLPTAIREKPSRQAIRD